jgi:hypothetical protein
MKKSRYIQLVLITSALASCSEPGEDWNGSRKVYMRSDTTAPYSPAFHPGSALLWFYAFRPYGLFNNGQYQRAGYYSGALHPASNTGTNAFKGNIARGGFGRGSTVSS